MSREHRSMAILAGVIFAVLLFTAMLAGCRGEADVASENTSKAADNFEVNRRIVFYNGITDSYILVIEGYCSLGNYDAIGELSVTCKVGDSAYKKHFLGLSDNVTYFAEQIDAVTVDPYHYRVFFRPEAIVPNIDLEFSGDGESGR